MPAAERSRHWAHGPHVDPGEQQSPSTHVPSEGDRVPMTVHAGERASPVPGSAHPSPGEASAEPLGPLQVLSPLKPAEQMALSHLQRHLASRTRPVLHHGQGEQNRRGLQCFCRAAAQGTHLPGVTRPSITVALLELGPWAEDSPPGIAALPAAHRSRRGSTSSRL